MTFTTESINLKKNGFVIIDIPKMHFLNEVKSQIINEINKITKTNFSDIEQTRSYTKTLDMKEIDKIRRMKLQDVSEKLIKALGKKTNLISKEQIYLQRYPHFNLNVSDQNESVTISHNEIMAGHAPNTIVCWIPFHDIVDESGLYFLDQEKTMKLINKTRGFKKTFPSDQKIPEMIPNCTKLNYGQAVLFNPFVFHGAKNHSNIKTRISIDFRFQGTDYPLFEKNMEYFKVYENKICDDLI